MTLNIGYVLPFLLRAEAVPRSSPCRVLVETLDTATDQAFRQIEAHVQLWVECAMFGAGASPRLVPSLFSGALDVTQVLSVSDADPHPNAVAFTAAGIGCEPAYCNVLLHKLLCLATHFVPLRSVTVAFSSVVSSPTKLNVVQARQSDFPMLGAVPFAYREDLDSGANSVSLTITFASTPPPAAFDTLKMLLWRWLVQGAQGGYISPPWTPERFALLASDDPTVMSNRLTWNIDEVDVDRRAFHMLINMIHAFSNKFGTVAEVTLA